ncbi:hypothetical protein TIFTF001_010215 [Ficus carica]|uniref:Uncharacterized protein n=1 Tax=Ficus carica TaxID=3494 RepID=A0AA87ZXT0_FICCA|nr:hypothetical protein TIFTF001_010215 [Ficus carica]
MEAAALLKLPFILFLSFIINGVSASHGFSIVDQPPAVLDSSGNVLLKGEYYFLDPALILPTIYSAAIIIGIYRNGTCWLQSEIAIFTYGITGLPVQFSPVEPNDDESIHESTDLNIKFSDELSPLCGGSSVVKVGELEEEYVSLGGVEGDRSSWFKIEKVLDGGIHSYKLVSSSDSQVGRDIGISTSFGETNRLAPADEPLVFQFSPLGDGLSASK